MMPIIVPMRAPDTPEAGCGFFWRNRKFAVYLPPERLSPAQSGPFVREICDSLTCISFAHLKIGSLSKTASTGILCPVAFFDSLRQAPAFV